MWCDWLNLLGNKYSGDLVKKEKSSAKKEKLKNFFSKTNENNENNEQGVISPYKYKGFVSRDLTSYYGFSDTSYLPVTQGARGASGSSGKCGASGTSGKSYSEYLAEVDRSIEYSEYIAEEVDISIKYSEYIAKKIDDDIRYDYIGYGDYLIENLNNDIFYEEYLPSEVYKHKIPCLVNKFNLELNQVYESDVCYYIINKICKNNLLDMYCPISVFVTEKAKVKKRTEHPAYRYGHITYDKNRKYNLNVFESKISKGEIWISK